MQETARCDWLVGAERMSDLNGQVESLLRSRHAIVRETALWALRQTEEPAKFARMVRDNRLELARGANPYIQHVLGEVAS